jgi:hypothetical protein
MMTCAPGVGDPRLLTFGDGDPPPLYEWCGFLFERIPTRLWVRADSRETQRGRHPEWNAAGAAPEAEESSLPGRVARPSNARTVGAVCRRRVLSERVGCAEFSAFLWVRAGSSPRGSLRRAGPSAGPAGVSVAARRVPRRTGDWIRGGCSLEATSAGAPEPCPGWPLCGRRRLIPVARYCLRRRAAGCRQGGPACEARGPQGGPAAAARDSSLCAVRVTARGGCSLEATSSGVSTLGLRPGEVAPSKPPPPGYRL